MTPVAPPPGLLVPALQTGAGELARRGEINRTAQAFEATFLSSMLQQMFSGLDAAPPFGGGAGEEMFKSVLTDAMAKQMSKAGGIGLADSVAREMLKLQGMT